MGAENCGPLTKERAGVKIRRRLRFSQWFTGVMFAAGVGSGIFVSSQPHGPDVAPSLPETTAVFGAVVAGIAEKVLARRSAERTVSNFMIETALLRGEIPERYHRLELHIGSQGFRETLVSDPESTILYDIGESFLRGGVAPVVGSLGGMVVGTASQLAEVQEGAVGAGAFFIAGGVIGLAYDGFTTHQHLAAYQRQLNNIDMSD